MYYIRKAKRAVTLVEVLTVIIIIAVLAALFLPHFNAMKENALDKEAKANLKLLQAAEKIYKMETGVYFKYGGKAETPEINTKFKLSLSGNNWEYSATGGDNLDVRATRQVDGANPWYRFFMIDQHEDEP